MTHCRFVAAHMTHMKFSFAGMRMSNRPVLLVRHIWIVTFQHGYTLITYQNDTFYEVCTHIHISGLDSIGAMGALAPPIFLEKVILSNCRKKIVRDMEKFH